MSQQIIDTPENWDAACEGYGTNVAPLMMESFAQEVVTLLEATPDHEILEVACGSGALTKTLANNAKTLLATDFSPEMLKFNEKQTTEKGITNVTFKEMDGQALDIPENTMDRAACMFGVMLFPNREKGFSELYRVLKSGGKAVVTGWAGPDKFEAFGLFLTAIQKAIPDFPKPTTTPPVFTLADLDQFKKEMEEAGFKNVEVKYVTRELELENTDQIWCMLTSGAPPVKMLLDKIGEEKQLMLRTVLNDVIREKFGDGPIKVSNTATFGVGEK